MTIRTNLPTAPQTPQELGEHAVVLGASMGGLLAASVLANFFRSVTVVERDVLPDDPANRRGVPQGRHAHLLLPRGAQILDELFPGLLHGLVVDGAPVLDDGDLSKFFFSFGGHQILRSGKAAVDSKAMATYLPSRPFLECHVRRRLQALRNVTILEGHDVAGLTSTTDCGRVTGVRVSNRDDGTERELSGDLIVDATGRGSRTPAWLESLGYGRPVEDRVAMNTTYASQPLRIAPGTLREAIVLIGPVPGRPTGMALFCCENDTWLFTVFGMAGQQSPDDRAGMLSFAQEFGPPHVLAAARDAEPLAEVATHRMPSSQWRRYDKMRRFPDGLLTLGDAICSFNPVYGQGMTVAALEASALHDCLLHGDRDLSRRFFKSAAKPVAAAWQLAAGADLALPEVEGPRPLSARLANAYVDWVLTACESDAVIAGQFSKVNALVDFPSRLLHPAVMFRVAAVNLRRRSAALQSPRRTPRTAVATPQ
jgi:2-polyprenyl-6-methoxyphenol hydroxylase-like FAD-dependent oxidoreductase